MIEVQIGTTMRETTTPATNAEGPKTGKGLVGLNSGMNPRYFESQAEIPSIRGRKNCAPHIP